MTRPAGAPLLSIRSLRHRWPGAPADTLDLPALDLAPAEAVFLHGPSGCGKSTLLSLMAGVLVADRGEVALLGQDWRRRSAARRDRLRADHVGYIFQQFNLLPYLSVMDNVRLPLRFSARRAQRAAADEPARLLARLGLGEALWRRPASALDEVARDRFMVLLRQACQEAGSALVMVSHDARLAAGFDRDLDLPALNRAAGAEAAAGEGGP